MRNHKFKLIRQPLERRHFVKGTETVKIPSGVKKERYSYFKIFGNEANEEVGVGDYNVPPPPYCIGLNIHGKNLMSGEYFKSIHSSLKISGSTQEAGVGFYNTTPLPRYNGKVIIGPKQIKFKKKTAYTLALHLKYSVSATRRSPGIRFDYSDGTYDYPAMNTSTEEFHICLSSDPKKDLVSISSHTESEENISYGLKGFGLYEGEHIEYDSIHETYKGQRHTIRMHQPLKKIDSAADNVDILTGLITRKIKSVHINEECDVRSTSSEGIFFIPLSPPMRPESRYVCTEYDTTMVDFLPAQDGSGIFIRPGIDITDPALMQNYLGDCYFYLTYVMADCEYENIEPIQLATYDRELSMDVITSIAPSKILAEYV